VVDFLKKLRESERFELIASKIISGLMRFSYYTSRWKIINKGVPEFYHKSQKPFIVCLWHDRLMLAPCVWKWKKPLHVLASNHRDGKFIAKVVENFSMPAIYGSTGKGVVAAKKLIKLSRAGEYVAIIPDGPRGPRHKLAPGVIAISKLANTDILTFSFCVKRFYRFNSWDRFILVWPFNYGVMVWGKPITPEELKGLSEKEAVALVENRINDTSKEAYRILNA
jgi:lysophospholipid acyltransferase (LPLAT)-like uncharacterized protein